MIEIPNEFPLPEESFQHQRSLLGTHVEAAQRSPSRARRRVVAIALAILVGGLLVAPAFGIGGRLLDLIQRAPGPPEARTPVWSPDGRRIAFTSRRDGNSEVYVVNADGSGQRRLTRNAAGDFAPTWSPDGRKIAFERRGNVNAMGGGLYVVNTDGSGHRKLTRDGQGFLSPDWRKIAFIRRFSIYVMNADGSERRSLTTPDAGRYAFLAWAPDGRKIAFLSDRDEPCDFCFHVYVMNADGSELRNLTRKLGHTAIGGYGSPPAWSPDGRRIAFVSDRDAEVYVMNADGSGQRRLTRKSALDADAAEPAWSPDGRKLAFVSNRDGNNEVYVMKADGSGQRSLTRNPAFDADPAWSPDGQKLAFVSNRDGSYEVYVMNADGSGQRRLTQSRP